MGKVFHLRPAMPGDSWLVLSDLRPLEVAELAALGISSEFCIRRGMELSDAVTIFICGECAGIGGIIDYGDHRVPWGVFTTVIDRHPLPFLRGVKAWFSGEDNLINYVDARNMRAVAWFKWLGFDIHESENINGVAFHPVTRGFERLTEVA